jgi:hypothetical protein
MYIKRAVRLTFYQGVVRVAIHRNNYNKTIKHIMEMVAEAKKDFPETPDEDIEVVVYGGEQYKGMLGIEFNAKEDKLPQGYEIIGKLDLTLT